MKSKLIKVIIACVVVATVSFGGYYGYKAFFTSKTVTAAAQYYTVSTRKMNLQVTVQGTGAAYAAVTKDVMPNNNGTLKDLSAKVGDMVTAGQKLYVSDSDDVRKNITNAQNNLEKQKLSLASDQSAVKVDDNKIAMDNLSVSDAQTQLNNAYQQLNKMTVTAPIGGVVTQVVNSNGDSIQSGKSVLTIVDMNSIKVKVSVDELNINKVKTGQSATIKFDAIKDKSYEGTVETIAQTGTTSNNVTTYDVVVAVKEPAGIKLGMNASVSIAVESKENALVVPSEAIIENNGQKFVRVEETDSTAAANTNQTSNNQQGQNQQGQSDRSQGQNNKLNGNNSSNRTQTTSNRGRLIAIKTGLETENFIEVIEGLTEGQKVIVQLPQTTTNSGSNKNNQGSFGGNMGGFGGNGGAPMPQGGGNNGPRN